MPIYKHNDNMTDSGNTVSLCDRSVLKISQRKFTLCHFVLTIFLVFLFVLSANSQENLPDLNSPLNEENLSKWKEYIFSDDNPNKRLRVAYTILRKYSVSGDWASAIRVSLDYIKAFREESEKNQRAKLQEQIGILVNYLIMERAEKEDFDIFEIFIKDNKNRDEGITALKMLSAYYSNIRMWDSAAAIWKKYAPLFPDYTKSINKTITLLNSNSEKVNIRNFGINVNTKGSEWDPNLSPDGKILYFSSVRSGGFGNADIWFSERIDGKWQKPKNLGKNVNGNKNETIDNVSPDGNTLFISGDFEGTFGLFDIYTASKTKDGWGELKHFPMPINSKYQDEACNLTADGKAIIFSSDRKGSIGGYFPYGRIRNGSDMGNMDIWVSEKQEDGSWGEPINLGRKINTPYSERAPFLHPDGKTLYFSSNARYGLGKLDVYKATRLSDSSWTEWSEPVNIGKEINTVEDDWGYVVNFSGDSALFAARHRTLGFGDWDLYSVSLPNEAKPEKVCLINGFVTDIDGKPLDVDIIWEDLENEKVIGEAKSDPQTGKYFITLPLGKFYGYFAQKKNYYPISNNINLKNAKDGNIYRVDIKMVSMKDLEANNTITLNNIFFDYDKAQVKKVSIPELKRIASFLKNNKKLNISIEGHTDNKGTKDYNLELSKRRAQSVKEYLIDQGINPNRLEAIGFGDTMPAFANTGEKNMSQNRRVEIRIKK